MVTLVLKDIGKTFPNGVRAVADISIEVRDGELLTVVGPSGAGKTTLLRLIAGLDNPTAGQIYIGDRDVTRLPPHSRNVAMVFQRPVLYPQLSVRKNLALALRLTRPGNWLTGVLLPRLRFSGASEWEKATEVRVNRVSEMLGLEDVLERFPRQLSGGQQQRVALGRAIIREPSFLLLDEPLNQLDVPSRAVLRRYLHLLHQRLKTTILHVTHDQTEAMMLGDRMVLLDNGAIQQQGTPLQLYDCPANRFVAGFVGWPAMNFLDGSLSVDQGLIRFIIDPAWSVTVAAAHSQQLLPYISRHVTLGIRPDDVTMDRDLPAYCAPPVEVTLVELLGNDMLITLIRDNKRLSARVNRRRSPEVGDACRVSFDMEHAYWFDELGNRILFSGNPAG